MSPLDPAEYGTNSVVSKVLRGWNGVSIPLQLVSVDMGASYGARLAWNVVSKVSRGLNVSVRLGCMTEFDMSALDAAGADTVVSEVLRRSNGMFIRLECMISKSD